MHVDDRVVGVDIYDFCLTGDVGRTLTTSGGVERTHPGSDIRAFAFDGSSVTSRLHKEVQREGLCHTLNTDSRNYVVIVLNDQGGV